MIDSNENSGLVRNLDKVKRLSPEVNIYTYYPEIKPFLFGTDNLKPITETEIKNSGGINGFVKNGKMIPNGGSVIIVRLAGTNVSSSGTYEIADFNSSSFNLDLAINASGTREKKASNYLFPSDLVSILISLAKVFYNSGYNTTGLGDYISGDSLSFVRKWGDVNTKPDDGVKNNTSNSQEIQDYIGFGSFYEKTFEASYSGQIQKLLAEVVEAARQFENKYEGISLEKFERQFEIQKKITNEISEQIFDNFIDKSPNLLKRQDNYKVTIKPILDINSELVKDSSSLFKEKLIKDIEEIIKNNSSDFFSSLFTTDNLNEFENNKTFDKISNYFLFNLRESDQLPGIKQTQIYTDFVKKSIANFLSTNEINLLNNYILPLFVSETETQVTQQEADVQDVGGETPTDEDENLNTYVSQDDLKVKLVNDVVETVYLSLFNDYAPEEFRNDTELQTRIEQITGTNPTDFSTYRDQFGTQLSDTIKNEIKSQVENYVLNNFSLDSSDLERLSEIELLLNEKLDIKIFDSEWYAQFLASKVEKTKQSSASGYPNFINYLYQQKIVPAIDSINGPPSDEPTDEAPQPPLEPQKSSGSVVPNEIQDLPTKTVTVTSEGINRLNPDKIRELQYESAWMYNRAIYELFTSKGINQSDIDPAELLKLQSSIFNYTAEMNSGDFNKLFGSSSARQRALLDFYQKNMDLHASIKNITTFKSAEDLLEVSINSKLKIDNPVLTENIKNTIDGLIIQYGLNQDLYGFDQETQEITQYAGSNKHDIIWFIDNISADRLALIFDMPPEVFENKKDEIKHLLKSYARYRASELSLHILNDTLQNGLVQVSEEDARNIEKGDVETIVKHLSFTAELSKSSREKGAETVAGAVDHKKVSKDKIQKQYKTFIPLWNQLTGKEQAIIYKKYGIPVPNGMDLEVEKLSFIPQFITFDVSEFGDIKKIIERVSKEKNRKLNKEERLELEEIVLIQNQLIREEKLAIFLNKSYLNESYPGKTFEYNHESGAYEGYEQDVIIEKRVVIVQDSNSFAERFIQDQTTEQTELLNQTRFQKFRSRFKNSKLKNLVLSKAKKLALEKAKSAFKKALTKTIAGASNIAIPGIGLAIMALSDKKIRRIAIALAAGMFAGLSALASYILLKSYLAFGSVTGMIGGILGGVSGFIFAGPIGILPGAVVGANTATAFFGDGLFSRFTAADATSQVSSQNALLKTANNNNNLSTFLNSYEGLSVVAAGGFSVSIVFITLFIVIIIQSAFIIPIPKGNSAGIVGSANGPGLPDGFNPCWPVTGVISQIPSDKHLSTYKISGISQAIDIAYRADLPGFPPPIYAAHDGVVKTGDKGSSGYGVYVIISSPGKYTSIYAHLSQIAPGLRSGDSIKRGQLIGHVGSTGNSTGPHLHYEFSPANILDAVPNGGDIKINSTVKENCSTGGEQEEYVGSGYLAIGSVKNGNLVASSVSEINSGAVLTCSWRANKQLEVSINANFFNNGTGESGLPVGLAGNNGTVKYWEDASKESINLILKSLVIKNNSPSMIRANSSTNTSDLSVAVTGIWESTLDSSNSKVKSNRTLIGYGVPTKECSGQKISGLSPGEIAVFLGVAPDSTYQEAENMLKSCGATEITHLDGGGSSAFCSDSINFSTTRPVPVNIGFKTNATIIKF